MKQTERTAQFSVSTNLPIIKCDNEACGHEFALLAHYTQDDYTGQDEDVWMQAGRCYFCPYCGKKNEDLERRLT